MRGLAEDTGGLEVALITGTLTPTATAAATLGVDCVEGDGAVVATSALGVSHGDDVDVFASG